MFRPCVFRPWRRSAAAVCLIGLSSMALHAATTYTGTTTVSFDPDPAPLCEGSDVTVTTTTTSPGGAVLISAGKVMIQIATDGLDNPVDCDQVVEWFTLNAPGVNPDGSGQTSLVLDLDDLTSLGLASNVSPGSTVGFRAHYVPGPIGGDKVGNHFADCAELSTTGCCSAVEEGDACTRSQGFYGNNANDPDKVDLSGITNDNPLVVGTGFAITLTSAAAIEDYLPAGGPPAALSGDHTDPLGTESGVFGGQVTTLKLNVLLDPGFGTLVFSDPLSVFDGYTVSDILDEMEIALGGGGLLPGTTIGGSGNNSYNSLATELNESFDLDEDENGDCEPSDWALLYLTRCD